MKVGKDGKLKLSKDERQIGNFIYKKEAEHIKITDINGGVTHRISRKMLMSGRLLDIQMSEKENTFLHNYAAMVYNFSGVLPDEEFMVAVNNACIACINRHKEFYGIKEDLLSEEDERILQEAKETYDAVEELKKEQ